MLDTVSAKELDRYVYEDGTLIIDLRSRAEYTAGHIRGALNVPKGSFEGGLPDRKQTMILYCDRGALSMAVARDLAAKGYRVKSVVGGYRAYRGREIVTGSRRE